MRDNPELEVKNARYKVGICVDVDKKLGEYRKTRIWSGQGVHSILTEKEIDELGRL